MQHINNYILHQAKTYCRILPILRLLLMWWPTLRSNFASSLKGKMGLSIAKPSLFLLGESIKLYKVYMNTVQWYFFFWTLIIRNLVYIYNDLPQNPQDFWHLSWTKLLELQPLNWLAQIVDMSSQTIRIIKVHKKTTKINIIWRNIS